VVRFDRYSLIFEGFSALYDQTVASWSTLPFRRIEREMMGIEMWNHIAHIEINTAWKAECFIASRFDRNSLIFQVFSADFDQTVASSTTLPFSRYSVKLENPIQKVQTGFNGLKELSGFPFKL
jgi:hypothetical protein